MICHVQICTPIIIDNILQCVSSRTHTRDLLPPFSQHRGKPVTFRPTSVSQSSRKTHSHRPVPLHKYTHTHRGPNKQHDYNDDAVFVHELCRTCSWLLLTQTCAYTLIAGKHTIFPFHILTHTNSHKWPDISESLR